MKISAKWGTLNIDVISRDGNKDIINVAGKLLNYQSNPEEMDRLQEVPLLFAIELASENGIAIEVRATVRPLLVVGEYELLELKSVNLAAL